MPIDLQTLLPAARRLGWSVATLTLLAGCDGILDVERPDIIEPGGLTGEAGAAATYAGAVGDFASALAGPGPVGDNPLPFLMFAGLFSDEFRFGSTPPEVGQFDQGRVVKENTLNQAIYLNIHHARESAEQAAARIVALKANDARAGELYGVGALATIVLGEHYCSGLPFSSSLPTVTFGKPLTTAATFDRALDNIALGAANTGGDQRVINFLAVLKGRALLNKGDFSGAAAAVAAVPSGYVYNALYGAANVTTQNRLRNETYDGDDLTVADREGGNGLDYASANDPRVPVDFPTSPEWEGGARLLTYSDYGAPVAQATGTEARLIEAEALLQAGDAAGWLDKLNGLRSGPLAPLADPGTATGRVDLMFRERAFWMYSTGHRVGDMRRLIRQYNRAVTAVFPTGPYPGGLTRGNQASIVIPTTEENNPNYKTTDCDPTKA